MEVIVIETSAVKIEDLIWGVDLARFVKAAASRILPCQFSTWVRPGKRTPPSVKFPSKNSGKKLFFGRLGGVHFIHFEGFGRQL